MTYLLRLTVFTLAYVGTALVSLQVQAVHDGITPIWPPSGIALFAFYRYGPRMWPVVAISIAFLAWHVGIPPLAAGIAMLGNIGEAALGCLLIRRFGIEFGMNFRDVIKFLFLPVLLAPLLGASVGATGMVLGGAGSWEQFPIMWLMWWVGDMVGILLFMPLLVAWWRQPKKWSSESRLLEWLIVTGAAFVIGWHTFYGPETADLHDHGNLQILVMPFLLWSAIRLGLRGVTLVSLISCFWVLWGAANTTGPFHLESKIATGLYESSFIIVITLTGLIVQALARESRSMVASLRLNQQQLESRVHERTADLEQSKQQLYQAKQEADTANASKTRFLAAASHDLRQPLQAIISHVSILSASHAEPALRESITRMDKAATSMRELLDKLLNISEIDTGQLTPRLQTFAVNDLLHELQNQFQDTASQKNLQLSIVPCSLWVHSDPGLIRIILQNLIGNAIKYTETGKILVGCRRRGKELRICVCDTGIGIAVDEQQNIFEEFYQLDNPARDRSLGTGFGLATVQRMAKLLGHTLHLWSDSSRGSCFAIDVPVARQAHEDNDNRAARAHIQDALPACTVLLVDDDEVVLHANTLLLESSGLSVLPASDADAAFDYLAGDAQPDIVISDYRLGGDYNGTDLVNALRDRVIQHLPAIILTGDIMIEDNDEALPEDCRFIRKPATAEELIMAIRQLVETEAS